MKIDSISRLLNSFGSTSQSAQTEPGEQSKATSEEAVKLSSELNDRSNRVAELKQQIQSGAYTPDTNKIAAAVARELFA